MPPLASSINALKLRESIQQRWDERSTIERPEHRFSLFVTQFKCLWRRNLDVVIPRMLFAASKYSQPFLISRTITYVTSDLPPQEGRNEAFRLILLTFLIYTGMAVTKGMYDIRMDRLSISNRLTMVGLIHNRCLTIKDGAFDDSVAVTLMSNDAEGVQFSGFIFHELWSKSIELSVGVYLLANQLGWVCIVPLLIVAFTSQASKFVATHITDRQKALSMANQKRISITKAILDSMKIIKMMGLVNKMSTKIQDARDHEIKMNIKFHWLVVAFHASASMLNIFSPVVTLVVYAAQAELRGARPIDANLVFTSLAMIDMVTSPATSLLILVPNVASYIAGFDRIQKYLTSPDRQDKREILDTKYANNTSGGMDNSDSTLVSASSIDDLAVSINDTTIRPASTADPVLKNISTKFKKGSLVVCVGPVGTGKTTLAKALLGDLSPDTGAIQTAFNSIAYCAQTAWLTNGTIQGIIQGPPGDHKPDQAWYKRVLYTCDLEKDLLQLPNGDQTIVGSRGITLSGGQKQRVALARAIYAHRRMIILDDILSALDARTESHIVKTLIGPEGLLKELGTTVLLITHTTQHLPLADHIIVLGKDGKIVEQGTWNELRSEAGYYLATIDPRKLLALLASLTINVTIISVTPYWLRLWAESDGHNMPYYSTIYFLLAVAAQIASIATIANVYLLISPQSSNKLHARLLRTVMNAPQSYFATTDTGSTLNRFSADIQMIDGRLASSLLAVSQCLFLLLSQCILLGIIQPLMIITLPLTSVVVYFIQKVYLAASRQARFLDLESKALVNSSFLETLEGVATIRAFGWQRPIIVDNVTKLDLTMRALYLLMCLQRWLNMVLDLTVLGLSICVVGFAIGWKGTTTGGQIGIALNVVLRANMLLLGLVESWTNMETSIGAISRLRAFEKDVQPEDKPGESNPPPETWPERGAITFDHMSAAYNPPVLALRDLKISIEAGKKVGVCGRTGSGKSSLFLSLLRLIEIESGTIWIDDLDARLLPRNLVRSRIITVPQEPMLVMTDTVRQNLDIADSAASDSDIIHTLKRVGLWSVFQARAASVKTAGMQAQELEEAMGGVSGSSKDKNVPAKSLPRSAIGEHDTEGQQHDTSLAACLDATMKSMPLSQGQQQLFSLARAILMRRTRGKIVLLDEATSSVDAQTDKIMQQLIREEFKDHTIVTVAHRLDTIMDSDIVLLLDAGQLVEAGPPLELLQKGDGLFKELYGKNHSS
ncbi:ABC transporter [Thozetella sp. PMI_491]|nr:ABC transporter [Thozetella sp. PMI_491]